MSHEIMTALYSVAEGAGWTNLGQPIPAEIAKDPQRILDMLGRYQVDKRPVFGMLGGTMQEVPDRSMLVGVWDNGDAPPTERFFEVTSTGRYHIDYRQPADILETFRDELARESLEISHAAVLKGGKQIAVCARIRDLEASARISGDGDSDQHVYLTAATGWDKSHGTEYFITYIRTVCANTLRAGLSEAEGKGRLVRRTASQRFSSYADLRTMMEGALDIVVADARILDEMTRRKLSANEAREYFAKLLDIQTDKIGTKNADGRPLISTRSQNQLLALQSAYVRGPGSQNVAADGTLYGAVNAVTYIVDWESQIRDTMRDGNAAARMSSATFGNGAAMKGKAVRLAAEMLVAA